MDMGNSTCKMEASPLFKSFRVLLLTIADAVELERSRLVLPGSIMAHHKQRHVCSILCWRSVSGRLSRIHPPCRPRIRCLPAPSIPATTSTPTTRTGRRDTVKLLRHSGRHVGHPVCDFPRHWIAAAYQSYYSRSHAGSGIHCHVIGHVLQRLHLHQHHPRCDTWQVLVRLDGCATTVWA
jgi:hypothetical protein